MLKPGFEQRPILWAAVVAPPGSAKTPGRMLARRPVRELQHEAWLRLQLERKDQPELKLPLEHYMTTDATKEALAVMCQESPGVLLERDEFGAWVNSFDAYRGGRGGDRQDWLSLWAGKGLKVDRKGADPLYIPHPAISVTGGIQPDMLGLLRNEAGQDGFIDRILFGFPDVSPALWSDHEITPEVFTDVLNLFRHLRRKDGHVAVQLSPEARRAFAAWYDDNARLTMAALPGIAGVYAKLPNQVARLALVLHCLTHPDDPRRPLSAETMDGAIELGEYFRAHAHRVQTHFGLAAPTPIVRLEEPDRARIGARRGLDGAPAPACPLRRARPCRRLDRRARVAQEQGIVACRTIERDKTRGRVAPDPRLGDADPREQTSNTSNCPGRSMPSRIARKVRMLAMAVRPTKDPQWHSGRVVLMEAAHLLLELLDAGIQLQVVDGRLRAEFPPARARRAAVEAIRSERDRLIDLASRSPAEILVTLRLAGIIVSLEGDRIRVEGDFRASDC